MQKDTSFRSHEEFCRGELEQVGAEDERTLQSFIRVTANDSLGAES